MLKTYIHSFRDGLSGLCFVLILSLAACSGATSGGNNSIATATPGSTQVAASTPTATAPSSTKLPENPLLGKNLLVNGDAESGSAGDATTATPILVKTIPGWERSGPLNILPYGNGKSSECIPGSEDVGPGNRGKQFFYGGFAANDPNHSAATSSITQTLDVSHATALFAQGAVQYTLSAWLGGCQGQDDSGSVSIQFLSASGKALGTAKIGPVGYADRSNVTGLFSRSKDGTVPAGTTKIVVTLGFTLDPQNNEDNDASADDLSLLLHA